MIRLAVLDDHPAALARLVAPAHDIELLAAAADAVSLARALDGRRPDVLIVDHDPRRRDAVALCRRVKARPDTPGVLIRTAHGSAALTAAARAAQADALVDTGEPAPVLIAAIRRIAAQGQRSASSANRLGSDAGRPAAIGRASPPNIAAARSLRYGAR
jgi:DNA-binding NarL/FixJ family response regulator